MTADEDAPRPAEAGKDFSRLPEGVRLEETIGSVESRPPPDPAAGRNVDQHRALRED